MNTRSLNLARPNWRSRFNALWRKLRGHTPRLDHSPFQGDFESWRRKFATLEESDMVRVKAMSDLLDDEISFALVVCQESQDEVTDPAKILGAQCWPSISRVVVDSEAGLLPQMLPSADWVIFTQSSDVLRPYALLLLALQAKESPELEVIYGDEEYTDQSGNLCPFMKPDWSPELYESTDYVGVLCIRRHLIANGDNAAIGIRELQGRVLGQVPGKKVGHVPHILVQRPNYSGAEDAHLRSKSIELFVKGQGQSATQVVIRSASTLYVQHELPQPQPRVSVIIPSRDRKELLSACVDSVLEKTVYPDYEIILIDNDSQDPATKEWFRHAEQHDFVHLHRYPHPFNFAAINNFGAKHATGEILIFLNDDTTVISSAWMTELVRHANRSAIGAVGAMLYYPNDTVQHAGVVCGISKAHIAGHIHRGTSRFAPPTLVGTDCVHNYAVVTGACLALRQKIFDKIDGFDEEFSVCYNDVDLCLRVRELGYRNVWTPHSVLYHHENVSVADRNEQQAKVYAKEAKLMRDRYGARLLADPAMSPNFALEGEQPRLAAEPRAKLPWR